MRVPIIVLFSPFTMSVLCIISLLFFQCKIFIAPHRFFYTTQWLKLRRTKMAAIFFDIDGDSSARHIHTHTHTHLVKRTYYTVHGCRGVCLWTHAHTRCVSIQWLWMAHPYSCSVDTKTLTRANFTVQGKSYVLEFE